MDYKFDVALSFAGEQRSQVEELARCLKAAGVRFFYDSNEKAELWGKDLYVHLSDVYQNQAQFCIILASKEYAEKIWTTHERQNAQARALREKGKEYILPVRVDDTDIPGIPRSLGYLDYRLEGPEGICRALLQKLARAQQIVIKRSASELRENGALLRVNISAPQIHMQEDALAGPDYRTLVIQAIVDSGASRTIVNSEVARSCKLKQTGVITLAAAAGSAVRSYPEYAASIGFPESQLKTLDTVPVIACPLPQQSVACLIGRDIMQHWRLTYDGRTGEFLVED